MRYPLAFLATAIALGACADTSTTGPTTDRTVAGREADAAVAPIWASSTVGTTGEGSQYAIFVPTSWNGDVVVYAHGIRDVAEPVGLPTASVAELRDSLGAMGYAVAYSSFSENGWAVKDGMERTHQLRGLFTSMAGKPRRTYIAGHSMGGLIALALAEKYPNQYDGALPMCGVVGGAQAQIDYLANVRSVFDVFYPGVLPGNALDMPASLNVNTQVLGPAQAAIIANPTGAGAIARIAQTPVPFASSPELVQSILTALAFDARGADDLLDRTHGHSPFGNRETVYTGLLPAPVLAAVNTGVMRFDETPDAASYLAKYYEPTGNLRIPVVTMHTTRDPVVPFFHEGSYKARATAAGSGSLLSQRSITRYGHCSFAIGEMTSAFRALATWVDTGIAPN